MAWTSYRASGDHIPGLQCDSLGYRRDQLGNRKDQALARRTLLHLAIDTGLQLQHRWEVFLGDSNRAL